jgi:hypothetical protein
VSSSLILLLFIFPILPLVSNYSPPLSSLRRRPSKSHTQFNEDEQILLPKPALVETNSKSHEAVNTQTIIPHPLPIQTIVPSGGNEGSGWIFNTARDAQNYGLRESQCSSAFEPLFAELDRAIEYRKVVGNITSDDVDIGWVKDGAMRIMIFERQVITFLQSGSTTP